MTDWNLGALTRWGLRSGLAVCDQAIFSGANLLLNIWLARWLTGPEYGAFAVAFTALLLLSGFHHAVVLEPMTVLGPARHGLQMRAYLRAQLKIHFALCGILTLPAAALAGALAYVRPHEPLGPAILGCAFATPSVLLLWVARRHCYCLRRPAQALLGSLLYAGCVLGGAPVLLRAGRMSPFTAFCLMAFAGALAAGAALAQSKVLQSDATVATAAVVRENWRYGRWLLGSAILYNLATQIQIFFAAAILGLGAAGVLRAAAVPMLALMQGITAVATLALPVLAADFARGDLQNLRRKGLLLTFALTTVVGACEVFLVAFSRTTERVLLHGRFAGQAWLIPTLGLVALCTAASGSSLVLRAMQRPESHLIVGLATLPFGAISAPLFTRWWGVAGAALSMVLTAAIGPVVYITLYRKWFPSSAVAPEPQAPWPGMRSHAAQ